MMGRPRLHRDFFAKMPLGREFWGYWQTRGEWSEACLPAYQWENVLFVATSLPWDMDLSYYGPHSVPVSASPSSPPSNLTVVWVDCDADCLRQAWNELSKPGAQNGPAPRPAKPEAKLQPSSAHTSPVVAATTPHAPPTNSEPAAAVGVQENVPVATPAPVTPVASPVATPIATAVANMVVSPTTPSALAAESPAQGAQAASPGPNPATPTENIEPAFSQPLPPSSAAQANSDQATPGGAGELDLLSAMEAASDLPSSAETSENAEGAQAEEQLEGLDLQLGGGKTSGPVAGVGLSVEAFDPDKSIATEVDTTQADEAQTAFVATATAVTPSLVTETAKPSSPTLAPPAKAAPTPEPQATAALMPEPQKTTAPSPSASTAPNATDPENWTQDLFDQLASVYDKSAIFLWDGEQFRSWRASLGFELPKPAVYKGEARGPFRIVKETRKPYHGPPALIGDWQNFVTDFNRGKNPECLTLVPVLLRNQLVGGIASLGPSSCNTADSLRLAQEVAAQLSQRLENANSGGAGSSSPNPSPSSAA